MFNPSTGNWSLVCRWVFHLPLPPDMNQHECHSLPKWLPMNSLYLGSAYRTTSYYGNFLDRRMGSWGHGGGIARGDMITLF